MLYLDKQPMPAHYFPNKELYLDTQVLSKLNPVTPHEIGLRFESNDDLVALMLLKQTMDDRHFTDVSLNSPFFPYSTMDHSNDTRPLSLKYVAELVNSLGFSSVKVMEPHSTVLEAMVDRLIVENHTVATFNRVFSETDDIVVCFPDLGAEKRYADSISSPSLTFGKKRNFANGKIEGMRCIDDITSVKKGGTYVILDDLCRRGGTFSGCGGILKGAGAGKVILIVTHMEPAAYTGILLEDSPVDFVYATDSCLPHDFANKENSKLCLEFIFEGGYDNAKQSARCG